MATIELNGKTYPYVFGLRSMMYYEHITGKPYGEGVTVSSAMAIHYSCLLGADPACALSFADFVAAVDAGGAEVLNELSRLHKVELERWNGLNVPSDEKGAKKKKK